MASKRHQEQPGYRAIEYWLTHLPFTDHAKAANIIHKVLYTLRHEALPHDRWFSLLERFHLAIDTVVIAARMEIYHLNIPLTEKHERSAQITQLQQELANCYADVARMAEREASLPLSLIATAAYRSMYHLGEVQKWSYQVYVEVPAGLWHTVYAMYHLAERLQLTSYPFTLMNAPETCVTLEDTYKRLLLLSAANTSRMQGEEISLVSQCISSWSGHVEIDKWQGQQNTYSVNLEADRGPTWVSDKEGELADQLIHVLGLHELNIELMRLANILERVPEGEIELEGKMINRNLVQRLLQVWHNKPIRQYSRASQQGAIRLYLDLEERRSNNIHDWQVINASETGYCLRKQGESPADLHVGQWLKIQTSNDDSDMGIVRWLQHDVQGGLQMGIQLMQHHCTAVDVMLENGRSPKQAWLLQSEKDTTQSSTLLVPTDCQFGSVVDVNNQGNNMKMRLGEKIEHGKSYSQFQLYPLNRQ